MQEKFSVVIEAVTTGFKSKMNEIKNVGGQTAIKMAELRREISTLKSEMKYTDPGTKAFKEYAVAIDGAEKELKQLKTQQKEFSKTSKSMIDIGSGVKKMGSNIKTISSHIEKMAIKARNSFKRMVLGILGVRTAFAALRKAVSSYMSFDQELSDRLSSAWAGLGAQLAPVIEYLINLFARGIAYINAFINALAGINLIARANSKALNKQAGAAKSTAKALTSLDEITNIQKDEGGGGGGAGIDPIELPEISMSDFMKNLIDNIKKGNWYEVGKIIADKLNNTLESINWDKIKQKAENIGKNIALFLNGGIENANWELVGGTIAEGLNTAFSTLYGFISTLNFAALGKAVADTIKGFFEKADWEKIGKTISEFIAKSLEFGAAFFENLDVNLIADSLGTLIENLDWDKIIDRWYKMMLQMSPKINLLIVKLVGTLIIGLGDALISWVTYVAKNGFIIGIEIIKGIINGITDKFTELVNKTTTKFNELVQKIRDKFIEIKESIKNIIGGIIQDIKDKFKNVGIAIGEAISGAVKNAINKVLNGAVKIINGFINAINGVISLINAIPGVKISKLSKLAVPQLATGTNYVPEDQMAYIHKGEAVIPKKFNSAEYFSNINDNTETNALLLDVNRTLLDILDKDTNLYVNGKELARTTYNDFQSEANRLGKSSVVNVR